MFVEWVNPFLMRSICGSSYLIYLFYCSALCQLCYRKGRSGDEGCCRRGGSLIGGSGTLFLSSFFFTIFLFYDVLIYFKICLFAALPWIPGQVREEIRRARCIRHSQHLPVTGPCMDAAPDIPPWASSPYTCEDSRPILQQRCCRPLNFSFFCITPIFMKSSLNKLKFENS